MPKNNKPDLYNNERDTAPRSVVRPGTVTIDGRTVIGDGTDFTQDDLYAFIYIPSEDVLLSTR